MSKWNTFHIILGGTFSVLAFYFLGREMLLGWIFQSIAGILYTTYFWRQKLPIMATVILGAGAILPIYGMKSTPYFQESPERVVFVFDKFKSYGILTVIESI